jgi:hypothetical protein
MFHYDYATVSIVEKARHGDLIDVDDSGKEWNYVPRDNYIGNDKIVFDVLVRGEKLSIPDRIVRVIYFIKSVGNIGEQEDSMRLREKKCPTPEWRISTTDPANWYESASLQALLTGAKDALAGFTDLPGASLGQTTGDKITLDVNAAGHTWFIDYTPYLNEEWLATSNPYEWKAKPGSEAEGKMDLLSVLLHEYGHVLGIEHSADQHDAMAATLQPGVQRLPNVEAWLALLNQQNGVPVAQKTAPSLTSPS